MTSLKHRLQICCCLFAIGLIGCSEPVPENPEAHIDFAETILEEHNFKKRDWARFERTALDRSTRALLVAQHDRLLVEGYRGNYGPTVKHHTASLAKSVVGGLGLALAIDRGWLTVDTTVASFYSAWSEDPLKASITVGQLAAHQSGLEDAEEGGIPHRDLQGWKGAFWKRDPNPIRTALDEAPVIFEPGSRFGYSNPGYAVLGFTLAAAAQAAGESRTIGELLAEELWQPLGIPAAAFNLGYGQQHDVDGVMVDPNWGGAAFTPRTLIRIGQLLAGGGRFEGRQLLSAAAVDATLRDVGAFADPTVDRQPIATAGWYRNSELRFRSLPEDAVMGAGAGQQLLLIVPSWNLVVVRMGGLYGDGSVPFWGSLDDHLFQPLGRTMRRPELPSSELFAGAAFAPVDSIDCRAESSDNWPISWASDDLQYTSYGDGWGFEPKLEEKLSLGYALLEGAAKDYRATNIRSDGERDGDGPKGAKASGLLALDGELYMWVRNLDNAELWRSQDNAVSWESLFRIESSFGSPSFLQRGQNLEQDAWVYTLSQDGDSAYEADDGIVLARAPRTQLADREQWSFFAGFDDSGAPRWSASIGDRRPVLEWDSGCARLDAVVHPDSGRLLMALGQDLSGGWSLLEAEQPWGPWKLVFQTPDWGIGATHGYRLPAKWIDGDKLALVFSGRRFRETLYDAFCVREMTLQRRHRP